MYTPTLIYNRYNACVFECREKRVTLQNNKAKAEVTRMAFENSFVENSFDADLTDVICETDCLPCEYCVIVPASRCLTSIRAENIFN